MVRSYLKIFLTILSASIFCLYSQCASSEEIRVIVSPVDVPTEYSSYTIYPNVAEFITNDIINELNSNLRFNVPDLNSLEDLLKSEGLHDKYQNFLKSYKDNGTIDYRVCGLLSNRLGIDKILLVSSSFGLQNMVMKRSFLYKIGITEVEPIHSFYKLNVEVALIDAQSCIIDFQDSRQKLIKANNFEVPTSSMNDNIVSTKKIKEFSEEVSDSAALKVFAKTNKPAYTRVKSNIISTSNIRVDTRDGRKTRDGHSYSTNNQYIKNKRIESFKNWVRERVDL